MFWVLLWPFRCFPQEHTISRHSWFFCWVGGQVHAQMPISRWVFCAKYDVFNAHKYIACLRTIYANWNRSQRYSGKTCYFHLLMSTIILWCLQWTLEIFFSLHLFMDFVCSQLRISTLAALCNYRKDMHNHCVLIIYWHFLHHWKSILLIIKLYDETVSWGFIV